MFLLLLLPSVIARGPPGILPPLTFIAESWYPSNLPTVKPPWRQPGVDINQFRTLEFTDNSVTATLEETVTKATKIPIDFQEDNITEMLNNSTERADSSLEEGSGIVEVRSESAETLTTGSTEEISRETSTEETEKTSTTTKEAVTTEKTALTEEATEQTTPSTTKTSTTTKKTKEPSTTTEPPATTTSSQNSTEQEEPFDGEDAIFDVTERSKKRGEGGQEKKKKDCPELIFVIDSSGNVVSQYEKQKDLVRLILLSLGHQKRRLGLMTYASRRKQRWNISPNHNVTREQYLKKLKRARFLGGVTATGAVLQFLAREATHSVVVLLTDGFSFDEVDEPAELLRSSNTTQIYVTGDYFPIVRPVLNQITGNPDHVFFGHRAIRNLIELLKC